MALVYIGAFPPGYGGVTVKNLNLYTAIKRHTEIDKVDLNIIKRGNVKEAFRLLLSLLDRRNRFVIGVSGKKTRKRFCGLLYHINKKSMRKSILIVMGGTASKDMASDKQYRKYVRCYQTIYVETNGMLNELKAAGLENGAIYPNCRFRPDKFNISVLSNTDSEKPLKCVFFSLIQEEKGVNIILKAAKKLPVVEFYFYGSIDPKFENIFKNEVDRLRNVTYKGIFAATGDGIYEELSQYDVLLFPTKWKIEGVPGILIEAKIAGLPCIVSNESYNGEIIRDGVDGIVLQKNAEEELADAIVKLDKDREMLDRLSNESSRNAAQYYIENNVMDVLGAIGGGNVRRCVFFSYIAKEKGADVILEAAIKYPELSFSFYGVIATDYEKYFLETVEKLPNVEYKGIFTGTDDERYMILSRYDILLLPTRWEAEGIPGIIVESRIAGLVPIVSDHNFNYELIEDGEDGILLKNEIDPDELANSIIMLSINQKIYDRLRQNSLKRAEDYYIENYADKIAKELIY